MRELKKIFSASVEGWSFKIFMSRLLNSGGGILLLMKTKAGDLFGCMLVRGFDKKKENVLCSDREAVVFSTRPKIVKYGWSFGDPDYALMWNEKSVSIGTDHDGSTAIFLDSSLEHALLEKSNVFRNDLLASKSKTDLTQLEVWKF